MRSKPKKTRLPTVAPDVDRLIIEVRAEKVILDTDLAALYGVTTKALNQAVKRKLDEVKTKEEALAKAKDALNEEVEKQLKQKLAEAEAKATKKVEDKFADQLKELQDSLKEKNDSIKTFRENELELRKQKQAL